PSADRRCDSSSAPSGAIAGGGSAGFGVDPESQSNAMWHSGRKSQRKQSAILPASIRSYCTRSVLDAGAGMHEVRRRESNIAPTAPNNANNLICQEKGGTGKPVGQITVTYQGPIADDGTCATNLLCNGTWHEGYLYTLDGGNITIGTATAYQGQAPFKDENGFA